MRFVKRFLTFFILFCIAFQGAAYATICQHMINPLYIYPNPATDWNTVINSYPNTNMIIMDPANGPGSSTDSNYQSIITTTKAKGIKVLGYVYTNYAARSLSTVESDANGYVKLYGNTDGIFVDQVSSSATDITYYTNLITYIKTKISNPTIILNFGTNPDQGYASLDAILGTFEGTYATYQTYAPPAWATNYPSSRFYYLIYNVNDNATMQSVLNTTQSQNVAYVYVSDSNSWFSLPAYFSAESTAIGNTCVVPASSNTSNTTTSTSTGGGISNNFNIHPNWASEIMAGPHFYGVPSFIFGPAGGDTSLTSVFVSKEAHHDDLHIQISKTNPLEEFANAHYLLPWNQGFSTISNIYLVYATSAFNGFPVWQTDGPFTVMLPYELQLLGKADAAGLKIAHYDSASKRWKVITSPVVVDYQKQTLSTTTNQFGYFTVVR